MSREMRGVGVMMRMHDGAGNGAVSENRRDVPAHCRQP